MRTRIPHVLMLAGAFLLLLPAVVVANSAKVVDPGGAVAVKATKQGLENIGAEKCKMCHKVQYNSWAEGAHAKRTPALDCEGCHGPGSEYKSMSVMKDPAKAMAAGLVKPTKGFCATCHQGEITDEYLKSAHAHKEG